MDMNKSVDEENENKINPENCVPPGNQLLFIYKYINIILFVDEKLHSNSTKTTSDESTGKSPKEITEEPGKSLQYTSYKILR